MKVKQAFLGGMSNYMKINRFLDSVVYPTAFKVKLATENEKRRKRAQKQQDKQRQISQAFDYLGKEYGPPPEKGPQPQGMVDGEFVGCPHRENGVKSDIKGISEIQIKGKKFIGVR